MSQQKNFLGNIYIQELTIIKTWCTLYYHHQDFMHNIPASVNPVTPLLQWDIWQSLYGHSVMPALKHSVHPETRKQTWNYFMSLLISQQKNILGNIYIQELNIIKIWCRIYIHYHHQDFMHNIPVSLNPVTPLLQWDIWQSLYGRCLMPTLKHSIHTEMRKQTWNNFMSLLMSQQKNNLGNIYTTFNHHQNLRYNIASSGFNAQYTCFCKSSDAFASMRYLTISVWP